MLYKFKSKTTGDLIMLEPNGRRVLEVIGKEAGLKGIILPEQMHHVEPLGDMQMQVGFYNVYPEASAPA